MNGMSGAPMSAKLAPFLATLPHVAVASPVITNFAMGDSIEILWGIDYKTFDALKPFTFIAGGPFQGPYDVIVDDVWAKTGNGHHVGRHDHSDPAPSHFRICGIVESGKGGRRLMPIDTLGALTGSDGKASVIYIKSDNPANDDVIRQEIQSTPGLQGYRVQPMADIISMYTPARFPGFNIALDVVIAIAVIVGFLVIFQSMYTAVLERTREIGILKSMGASKLTVVGVFCASARCWRLPACWLALRPPSGCACCSTSLPGLCLRTDRRLDRQGNPDRFCGRALRCALSGLDGRPQRPDRRPGLRVTALSALRTPAYRSVPWRLTASSHRIMSAFPHRIRPQFANSRQL